MGHNTLRLTINKQGVTAHFPVGHQMLKIHIINNAEQEFPFKLFPSIFPILKISCSPCRSYDSRVLCPSWSTRRNQQWSPENLASCPPMLGSREGMLPPGGSSTLPVQQDTGIRPIWGESSSVWRLESLWLNFRDDQLLSFSCGISNIHTCIEEQPEPFLSTLWWYQRQKKIPGFEAKSSRSHHCWLHPISKI